MTTVMAAQASPARGILMRLWFCLILMGVGTYLVSYAPTFFDARLEKTPAPLAKPLDQLPRDFLVPGKPTLVFAAGKVDGQLSEEIVEALGTHNYLLRNFTLKGGADPHVAALNLNYYEKGEASPHVPDVCWVGSGMIRAGEESFTVPHVPHKDGTYSDIEMRMLSFFPANRSVAQEGAVAGADDRFINVAYVFHVNGAYVANRSQVSKTFWRPEAKYAYHCKIEISIDPGVPTTRQQAREVVGDFLCASLPDIEKCLPDWKQLSAGVTAATSPTLAK